MACDRRVCVSVWIYLLLSKWYNCRCVVCCTNPMQVALIRECFSFAEYMEHIALRNHTTDHRSSSSIFSLVIFHQFYSPDTFHLFLSFFPIISITRVHSSEYFFSHKNRIINSTSIISNLIKKNEIILFRIYFFPFIQIVGVDKVAICRRLIESKLWNGNKKIRKKKFKRKSTTKPKQQQENAYDNPKRLCRVSVCCSLPTETTFERKKLKCENVSYELGS